MNILKILFVRLRFLFVFVAIGLIVGNWSFIMNVVDKLFKPPAAADVSGEFEWYCPMHPSVVRGDPAQKCPICGMPLSKRKKGEKAEPRPDIVAQVQLSPQRIRQAGVSTEEIEYRTLVREIRTFGTVEWDERKISHISARLPGRADELFINFTGVRVRKGDPVYRLYSPELVTTQEEYFLALKSLDEIKAQAPPDAAAEARARRLAESARERMKLWGIAEEQIAEFEKTRKPQTHHTITSPIGGIVIEKDIHAGHYVQVGEDPYTVVDDSMVWVQVDVFERDLGLLKVGQGVEIATEAYPGEAFRGTVVFIAPELRAETRSAKARVEVPNPHGKLKAGMYVNAALRIPIGKQGEVFYGC